MKTLKERLEKIHKLVNKNKDMQVGGVRFDEKTYIKIDEIARYFGISKQELIRKIVEDFLLDN